MKCTCCGLEADKVIKDDKSGLTIHICSKCMKTNGLEAKSKYSYCGEEADKQIKTKNKIIMKICNKCEKLINKTLQVH